MELAWYIHCALIPPASEELTNRLSLDIYIYVYIRRMYVSHTHVPLFTSLCMVGDTQ